jgi:hypothetical protein
MRLAKHNPGRGQWKDLAQLVATTQKKGGKTGKGKKGKKVGVWRLFRPLLASSILDSLTWLANDHSLFLQPKAFNLRNGPVNLRDGDLIAVANGDEDPDVSAKLFPSWLTPPRAFDSRSNPPSNVSMSGPRQLAHSL